MSCPYQPGHGSAPEPTKPLDTDANEPIPQPDVHWFTKNLPEMDPSFPIKSLWRLMDIYGPIFKLDLVTHQAVFVSSNELINECMNEDRFEKKIEGGLKEVRPLLGDGLFSAYPEEPNWWKAHRILIPVFGPLAIRKMFPEMLDIASQMVLKWDRMGPDHEISTDDFTRMAFDTIGLCAFSYRFNSFYLQDVHPFAQQMADVLIASGQRANRTAIENYLRVFSAEKSQKDIEAMWKLCDDLVAERKAHPKLDSKDLLNTMLNTKDSETGEKLSDENVRLNMCTFLVAGHETTSGTLAFMFYYLLKNPDKLHKAQAEVDRVVGDGPIELKHLSQLKYIEACIRETLRYQGPINLLVLRPKEDTVIGGKYHVSSKGSVQCILRGNHHDPKVWGDDADVFRPERLMDGGYEALPPNALKPFGNGKRACIGRFFAEQEMLLATALILQRFQVEMADPSYNLTLKSTLTVKPKDFKIKVRRRPGKGSTVGIAGQVDSHKVSSSAASHVESTTTSSDKKSLLILYGSNAGTCKALAEDLETAADSQGFAVKVQTMDQATEHLPKDIPIIIITPSYEGKPADNAKKFVAWLESGPDEKLLKDVKYAVFGVGNSEWASTYHRVPKLVDEILGKTAHRCVLTGFVDVKEDLVGPWEEWKEKILGAISGGSSKVESASKLSVSIGKSEAATKLGGKEISYGYVRKNEVIAGNEVGPAKRHIDIELSEGVTYRTGDYLVVLPYNSPTTMTRVASKFRLHLDDIVNVAGTNKAFLLGNGPSTLTELLGTRVELGTPVSQRQLQTIASTATSEGERKDLETLSSSAETFKAEVLAKRKSVLDILEDYPSTTLSFGAFLDMLKPLSPRQYSISSSPLATAAHTETGHERSVIASLTFDVHEAPARSGHDRIFQGVASTYLARQTVGSKIRCFVRATNTSFHLPNDSEIPVIMISAGTGIAPMRGFIEERAQIAKARSKKLGPALLYFGSRDFEKDYIYASQLAEWEALGAVKVRPAFSKRGPEGCCKYVPDRMWEEREEIADLFVKGAKIFVCGSASKLAKSSADVCKRIWREKNPESGEEEADKWLDGIREDRYVSDVFD